MAGHDVGRETVTVLLLQVYGKVVRIHVAIQAAAEAFMQTFAMWFAMTILAGWNLSMRGVTCCALQGRVLGHVSLQIVVDRIVARTAGHVGNILRVLPDVRGAVRGMTKKAFPVFLLFHMWLMAVKATGNGSVYLGMAALAVELGVVDAWEFRKLSSLVFVADCTDNHAFLARYRFFQPGKLDYLGCMGLLMALHACDKVLSMRKVVAILALWHDLVPIALSWVVGVELRMAGGAVNLMLAALVLQPFELIVMASAAFHRRERFDFHCVYR
jgi:hypothetical protein